MATLIVYCLLYAGGMAFLAGSVARAVRYAKEPMHLRWEIYPVPRGRSGELKIMLPEILFLKGLWEFNRTMWLVSYPFHLGMYLIAGSAAAAFVLPAVARALGLYGLALVLAGSLGLLIRRLTNAELKIYTTAGDLFNLIFFAATSATVLAGYALRPAGTPGPLAIARGALALDTSLRLPGLLAAGMTAGALLLAYIPLTHMSHFIAKYFTYHNVRWDERANVAGGTIQKRMAEYLMYRPTWSAPHIGSGGERTWVDVATTNPAQGGAK